MKCRGGGVPLKKKKSAEEVEFREERMWEERRGGR
jgi:hypothetical protein